MGEGDYTATEQKTESVQADMHSTRKYAGKAIDFAESGVSALGRSKIA